MQGTRLRTREPRRIKKLLRHTVPFAAACAAKGYARRRSPLFLPPHLHGDGTLRPTRSAFARQKRLTAPIPRAPRSASIGALRYPGRAENNIPHPPLRSCSAASPLLRPRRARVVLYKKSRGGPAPRCGADPFLHTKKPTGSPARRRADQSLRYFLRMSVGDTFITFLKLRLK